MSLFQKSVLADYYKNSFNEEDISVGWEKMQEYQAMSSKIKTFKEEVFQSDFLRKIFVDCLGYKSQYESADDGNLFFEEKNLTDSKKADGAIKIDGDVRVVIELKGTNTKDLKSVENQAFGYKSKHPKCRYIVTSNFEKLRFYIDNAVDYEEFDLFNLTRDDFKLLHICLHKDNIFSGTPLNLKNKSVLKEENITKKLYKDYSTFRRELFCSLVKSNPQHDKLILFKKTQKLLDRFLFILFAEDRHLLPANSIIEIIKVWENDRSFYGQRSLYEVYKGYFKVLNNGRPASEGREAIFAYNGGLFAEDIILDKIEIEDEILLNHTKNLSHYDFQSDISVNILGHIFEHSLSEIEEIQNEIAGVEISTSKRKKDGIFYTPQYITKYIVDNTLGKLCKEKKSILELDHDFDVLKYQKSNGLVNKKGQKLYYNLESYKNWLLELKIVDPACGSGAFLNEALSFLIKEHKEVDDFIAELTNTPLRIFDTEKSILENNIYGVDINEESIEIAKLSMWLRTAKRDRKLTSLNNNIKCGNSLIDDPIVAGRKAFNWKKEFPQVFASGGFDVVIGNPPYGAKISKNDIEYISNRFNSFISGEIDTYIVFYFESLSLLKDDGLLGFITPDTWLTISRGHGLRKYLFENVQIHDLHDWYKPFKDAKDTRCHTIIFSKTPNSSYNFKVIVVDSKENPIKSFTQSSKFLENLKSWNLYTSPREQKIFSKMDIASVKMDELYNLKYGLRTGNNNKYLTSDVSNSENKVKIARGSNIENYYFNWEPEYLTTQDGLPTSYFEENVLNNPKIIIQYVRTNSTAIDSCWLEAALIEEPNFVPLNSTSFIYSNSDDFQLKYLLCLISSKLMNYYYKGHYTDVNVKPLYLSKLPIINANQKTQNKFVEKAELMLSKNKDFYKIIQRFNSYITSKFSLNNVSAKLNNYYTLEFEDFIKELNKSIKKNSGEKLAVMEEMRWMEVFETKKAEAQILKTEINKTDKEIDQMVYKLYGLTKEEIEIVENN